jgi:hypothetical protein
MRRSIFFAAAIFAAYAIGPASAEVAPFGCDASAGQTCYFRIYYTPGLARMVQLPGGMKVTVPDVNIGRAHYCGSVGKPPAPKCSQKPINIHYNN